MRLYLWLTYNTAILRLTEPMLPLIRVHPSVRISHLLPSARRCRPLTPSRHNYIVQKRGIGVLRGGSSTIPRRTKSALPCLVRWPAALTYSSDRPQSPSLIKLIVHINISLSSPLHVSLVFMLRSPFKRTPAAPSLSPGLRVRPSAVHARGRTECGAYRPNFVSAARGLGARGRSGTRRELIGHV
jgi:hypothetical protein